ncbi:MAG: transcriptional repressor general negative regulator of transcription subunit 4 [Pycnora praestabilis]|nr:MAG: transcriptional repressor general negative regulator of transcription subunit 4 [Pycnora praestabilis]
MASRVQQDSFIEDDGDDSCPLCVEEFDLSDRNFRPCPCGYQVCQFCFNNIKNNMNGLCPACRRPYDEKSIEWKVVSPEEFKADVALQAKKKAAARQKEAQKREVETLNRKHLAGLRVVQKNLVYVVGLNPRIREEDLLQTLRGDQYFGQYGKIVKIVVAKAKDGAQSMGVYVTFAREQDAASCIAAVDGSQNGDRTLRAQLGTTKYCSAYLRNEPCNNRNCMFLHESGENDNSFTRQDLSSMNVVSTQRPAQPVASSSSSITGQAQQAQVQIQAPQPQPPPQKAPQNVASAAPAMGRQSSKDGAASETDSGDGSALPSSASWANKSIQLQQSRRASLVASASTPSPRSTNAAFVTQALEKSKAEEEISIPSLEQGPSQPASHGPPSPDSQRPESTTPAKPRTHRSSPTLLKNLLKAVSSPDFKFVFSASMLSIEDLEAIANHPPLFDPHGGIKRRVLREQQERDRRRREEEAQNVMLAVSTTDSDEPLEMSGSLQLGGEPETTQGTGDSSGRDGQELHRQAIQPPSQQVNDNFNQQFPFANNLSNLNINGRGLNQMQQQQLLLLQSNKQQSSGLLDQFPSNLPSGVGSGQAQQAQPSVFQNPNPSLGTAQAHARQSSRYTFANDSSSASAVVKPAANAKLMAQQSAMMPSGNTTIGNLQPSQYQQHGMPLYGTMQGPPPGLKTTGTPPVSGGGMFGQGHGFASALGAGMTYGNGSMASKDNNTDVMRDLLRGRSGTGSAQGPDAGKREFMFPSFFNQFPSTSTSAPAPSLLSSLYGPQGGPYQDSGPQKQKKKGKKHRHANTSSSGGGGMVDLADPSILQARMQQGGAGAGQGLFSGHGQGSQTLILDEEAFTSVDALVDDETNDVPSPQSSSVYYDRSGRSTPITLPPGLPLPRAHPLPTLNEELPSTRGKAISSPTTTASAVLIPAVPIVSLATPTRSSTPAKTDRQGDVPSWINPSTPASKRAPKPHEESIMVAAKTMSVSAIPSRPNEKWEVQPPSSKGKEKITDVEPSPTKPTPNLVSEPIIKDANKRQHPGKLDIFAANQASMPQSQTSVTDIPPVKQETPTRAPRSAILASSATSRPETPSHLALHTPDSPTVRQTPPRTLRVLPTPKVEIANPIFATSTTAPSPPAASSQQASRQPSLASINRPATPASEIISETNSTTSASVSRANSPPPTKIGSAPVRINTKSQQKKQRQERAKLIEESKKSEEGMEKPLAEGTMQAPIVGRKKKTKKPGNNAAESSTPNASRPASPIIKEKEEIVRSETTPPAKETKKDMIKNQEEKRATPPLEAGLSPLSSSPAQKSAITPASIIAELQASGELNSSSLEFFKPVIGLNHRHDITPADYLELDRKLTLTSEEQANLAQGLPVHITSEGGSLSSRILVSAGGSFLRGLSEDQEERYIELEKRTINARGPTRFVPSKQSGENGFAIIGGRVVQTAPDVMSSNGAAQRVATDPASKMRVDEALNYINQFVLPALPTNDKLEKTVSTHGFSDFGLGMAGNLNETGMIADPTSSLNSFGMMGGTQPSPLPSVPLLSIDEAEVAMLTSRKQVEGYEKKLAGLVKKNRRLVSSWN